MKIVKYTDYIKEGFAETPESLAEMALVKIKEKILAMFPEEQQEESEDEVISFSQARERGERKEKAKKKITFADYGTRLVDTEISRTASTLSCKLDDGENWYSLIFFIELTDAVPKDPAADFGVEDIEKCRVKMKRYNSADQKVGETTRKTMKIDDIDEEELVNLKIEVDGEETEELGIETE